MIHFKHLREFNQTYLEHFMDAIKYYYMSQKASIYFLLHSIYYIVFNVEGIRVLKSPNLYPLLLTF